MARIDGEVPLGRRVQGPDHISMASGTVSTSAMTPCGAAATGQARSARRTCAAAEHSMIRGDNA